MKAEGEDGSGTTNTLIRYVFAVDNLLGIDNLFRFCLLGWLSHCLPCTRHYYLRGLFTHLTIQTILHQPTTHTKYFTHRFDNAETLRSWVLDIRNEALNLRIADDEQQNWWSATFDKVRCVS